LDAVREDPFCIQYIKKPTERVQLVAVQEDPESIQYIKKPSDLVEDANFHDAHE
jgi:hypothetical protein